MPRELLSDGSQTPTVHESERQAHPAGAEAPPPELARAELPKTPFTPHPLGHRLRSLDVYRGLIMTTLAFVGFGLASTATNHLRREALPSAAASAAALLADPQGGGALAAVASLRADRTRLPSNDPTWLTLHYQFEHVQWVGCTYWDMIQPSFMFMVGAALAFSFARRQAEQQSYRRMLAHAVWRALVLVFLGIFLISNRRPTTDWSLMNVLTQIGLGYAFLFLLAGRSLKVQGTVAVAILVLTWLLYVGYGVLYPDAVGIDLARGNLAVGVSRDWAQAHLTGIGPAWHKNANVGHALDLWLLNLLPQPAGGFRYNGGGYQTLNFLPSLATMIFGLMAAEVLRSGRKVRTKIGMLIVAGLVCLALGWALDATGICPIVKRIWTPAWALFSTGWCCLILATLFTIVDVIGFRIWAWPLVVVGVNSIAIYCMGMLLRGWTADTLRTHLGRDIFTFWGNVEPIWSPTVQATLVGLAFWLACLWMYRNKIYIRL